MLVCPRPNDSHPSLEQIILLWESSFSFFSQNNKLKILIFVTVVTNHLFGGFAAMKTCDISDNTGD
jgi:hypothetical protein